MNTIASPHSLKRPRIQASQWLLSAATVVASVAVARCSPGSDDDDERLNVEVQCTEQSEVQCRDESFQTLGMSDALNARPIEDALVDDHHEVHVDATAGGFGGNDGFVYGKFTDSGFVKVDLLDDASFASMDWDIAFRRFVIRMNGGTGGPSCVSVANLGANNAFDDIDEAPTDADFNTEQYFGDTCELIPDGSGLPTAPGTLTQNYWKYSAQQCLQMTDNVYLVRTADGHIYSFQVFAYYDLEAQAECDADEESSLSGSANVRFRWKKVL